MQTANVKLETDIFFQHFKIHCQTSPVMVSESSPINPKLGVVDCGSGEKNGGDDDHMGGFG